MNSYPYSQPSLDISLAHITSNTTVKNATDIYIYIVIIVMVLVIGISLPSIRHMADRHWTRVRSKVTSKALGVRILIRSIPFLTRALFHHGQKGAMTIHGMGGLLVLVCGLVELLWLFPFYNMGRASSTLYVYSFSTPMSSWPLGCLHPICYINFNE